jgi:hypothetical protein
MSNLSKFRKGKILLQIINDLNAIEDKRHITIEPNGEDSLFEKIAERTGIQFRDRCEAGIISINEFIQCTFDEREHNLIRKLEGHSQPVSFSAGGFPGIEVSETLKEKAKAFIKANIPSSGPCKTIIGEMFRAIQRIQYRAMNDGDLPWIVGSPSFMSYIFLSSEVDRLNYLKAPYREEKGTYGFTFTDDRLTEMTWDGKIFIECDDSLCSTLDITMYQLIDLMEQGVLTDSPNEWDSRDYTSLRSDEYDRYNRY